MADVKQQSVTTSVVNIYSVVIIGNINVTYCSFTKRRSLDGRTTYEKQARARDRAGILRGSSYSILVHARVRAACRAALIAYKIDNHDCSG